MSISHLIDQSKDNPWAKLRIQEMIVDGANPSIQFNGTLPESSSLSHVLGIDATTKHLTRRPVSSIMVDTVYSADGTLTGDRVVDADSNSLGVASASDIELETTDLYLTNAPQSQDGNTQLLTRNSATGRVEERAVSSLPTGQTMYDAIVPDDYSLPTEAITAGATSIFVRDGTYTETTVIDLSDKIMIGESRFGVNIVNNTTNAIELVGSNLYNTGTITLTNASTTVTGSGTTWTGNVSAEDRLVVDNMVLVVDSVDSDTQITLTASYKGVTRAGLDYKTFSPVSGRVENMTISSTNNCIDLDMVAGFSIENLSLTGTGSRGLYMLNSTFVVANESIVSNKAIGIDIDSSCCVTIEDNEIIQCSSAGIMLGTGEKSSIRIVNNNISGNEIGIDTSASNDLQDSQIIGNIVSNNNDVGINLRRNLSGAEKVNISSNQVTDNGSYGIQIQGEYRESAITGNSVLNNADDGLIFKNNLGEVSSVTITGNTSSSNTGDGITIQDSVQSRFVVSSNVCSDNTSAGIRINSSASNGKMAVNSNLAHDNTGSGFDIDCDKAVVTGNSSENNGGDGFSFDGDYVICSGNMSLNNTGHGIIFDNSDYSNCTGCVSYGNGSTGLTVTSGSNNLNVTSNQLSGNTGTSFDDSGTSTNTNSNVT